MKTLGAVAWRWLALLAGWGLLLAPGIVLVAPLLPPGPWEQLVVEAWSALTLLGASWALTRLAEGRRLPALGFSTRGAARDGLLGLGLGAVWLAGTLVPLGLGGAMEMAISGQFSGGTLALVSLAVLLNALTQELLVHGYLLRVIQWRAGWVPAVTITSVLFCALHAPAFKGEWRPALNVLLAGVLLGLATWRSEGLWLPTALHFAWNLGLGPLAGLTVSGKNPYDAGWRLLRLDEATWWAGGAFGVEGSVVMTLTALGLIAWMDRRRRAVRPAEVEAQGAA